MPLHELLSVDRIAILTEPGNRVSVIDAAARLLADPLYASGNAACATIRESLQARERLASTAIGHGVAIPHGRVAGIGESRGAFLRLAEPVDFDAIDGEPVDLVLAMAIPEHSLQEHLQQLAELAEHFSSAGFRDRLRAASSVAELGRYLLDGVDIRTQRPTVA
ncbi:PTS sugar transporter subunit IIA [Lysobacter sp. F6437]|uniref:PTS sugar transporter subunit IIA n=1 Tax=Lysobacter sp. F6437 TaxID=3459296 RepID=UPI00403DAC81